MVTGSLRNKPQRLHRNMMRRRYLDAQALGDFSRWAVHRQRWPSVPNDRRIGKTELDSD